MSEKIKKYAIVVFLTLLVWAWAYNDLEETETRPATLNVAKSPDSDIFVKFDPAAPVEMDLTFKGTPEKIRDLEALIDEGLEDLKFDYSPKNKNRTSPYPLDIMEFLDDSSKLRKLELDVVKSSVELVEVTIEKLVRKELKIKCVDEDGNEVKAESISPSLVHIYVKQDYTGDATVVLTDRDIALARKDRVLRQPFVELAPNDRRVGEPVRIELPQIELPSKGIQTRRIGYSFGKTLMGKYKIELENEEELVSTIMLKATPEAFDAYENMDIQIFVQALDTDAGREGTITRDVLYNFPQEEVAAGHIRLADGKPRQAKFKLVKIEKTSAE